jgi:AraC-like DNA-binding protein
MSTRTISAAWVKGIFEALSEAGLNSQALFSQAGVNVAELENSDARFTPDQMSAIWELASVQSGNPAIGVAIPKVGKPACFDAVAFVMMSCSSLHSALQHLTRYLRIVSDAADINLIEDKNGYSVTLKLFAGAGDVPRQRIEYVLTTIFNFCRWISGRNLQPLRVDFASPVPDNLEPYQNAFNCALHFDAPVHRLLFVTADMMMPLPTSNALLAEIHNSYASEHLKKLSDAKTSYRVRELIISQLSNGEPLRAEIASSLCLSERTLQRRLREELTSFQDLVDATRRELAEQYLSKDQLTLTQTAALLGFADQSTFFRCSKRWFGMSPKEYRVLRSKRNSPCTNTVPQELSCQ